MFDIDVVVIEPGAVKSEWSGIGAKEAERISGKGAYAGIVAKLTKLQASQRNEPPPSVITDLIVKAVRAGTPKTRYHGGMLAGPMLFMRRYLPDRLFDRVIMLAFR